VRYYERVGLLAAPERTASGYRDYDDDAAARLLSITRSRRMGLSCEQITAVLPVWAGVNCGAAQERVARLVVEKQAEIAAQIAELQQFAAQLDDVWASLDAEAPSGACRGDLTSCVPDSAGAAVAIELTPRH
jgi:DNA-binding transcriptional MerR regulator